MEDDLVCRGCELLKYSCGENHWEESIGCYGRFMPIENKCKEKVKNNCESYEDEECFCDVAKNWQDECPVSYTKECPYYGSKDDS